jgi:hypothetical protein
MLPRRPGILLLAAASALAQEWPAGTVRVLLPVPPGGPMDLPSHLLVDRLAAQTNGVFILEHRSGAGGTISALAVAQAPPDGNTLLFTTSSISAKWRGPRSLERVLLLFLEVAGHSPSSSYAQNAAPPRAAFGPSLLGV